MNKYITFQIGITVLATIVYFFILSFIKSAVAAYGEKYKYQEKRIVYIKKFFAISLFSILLVVISIIWGFNFRGILILSSSLFAVIGIALFASWSILSNITSGVVIFFSSPYKIGDNIKIIDGENSVEGEIIDMTLFQLRIKDRNENLVSYPNNLAIQKPTIKL